MEKTWKPTAAGVLCIVSGACGLLVTIGMIIAAGIIGFSSLPGMDAVPGYVPALATGLGVPFAIVSVVSLVGGIFALQRRNWGFALAGSISSILSSIPLLGGLPVGIAATVLTAISKPEYT